MQKDTVEQKLLKIIEASKSTPLEGAPVTVAKKSSSKFSFSIRHLNVFLIIFLLAAVFYFIIELNHGFALISEDATLSPRGARQSDVNLQLPQSKNISVYLSHIAKRDLFKPYEMQNIGMDTSALSSEKAILETKMSQYRLVGIAWLDQPETVTVMIENKANKTTRFLKEGDKIDDVTVKTIFTNKVVFSYANEEIVIKL